jgi:hypothetical protein
MNMTTATIAKSEDLNEKLIAALVYLVNNLPRGTNKATGQLYKGLRQDRTELVPMFFTLMAKWGHPLAGVTKDHKECNHDTPCNSCRRDVWESVVSQAVTRGLIVRQGRKGQIYKDKANRMVQGKGFVMFYRLDEFSGSSVEPDFMDKLLASVA